MMKQSGLISLAAWCLVQSVLAAPYKDLAQEDVTIYVVVPQEIPLTVKGGDDFQEASKKFIAQYGLNQEIQGNLTLAFQTRLQQMMDEMQPLLSVGVKITDKTPVVEDGVEKIPENPPVKTVPLGIYEGDTPFDAVFRFCKQYGLDIYDFGRSLEGYLSEAIENATAAETARQAAAEEAIRAENAVSLQGMVLSEEEREKLEKEREVVSTTVEGQEVNFTKFKLFSIPVKIDDKEEELDFYNGDNLNGKVSEFCVTHGLNETYARQPLIDAVLNYTSQIQQKIPNSLWVESL